MSISCSKANEFELVLHSYMGDLVWKLWELVLSLKKAMATLRVPAVSKTARLEALRVLSRLAFWRTNEPPCHL